MNKSLKLILGLSIVLAVTTCSYLFYSADDAEAVKSSKQTQIAVEDQEKSESKTSESTGNKEKQETKETSVKKEENKANEQIDQKEDRASESKPVEQVDPVSSDKLNSTPVESQKSGKTIILFRDGTKITDSDIRDELDNIPDQISNKMSLTEIKSFLAWKKAYDKVITEVANKSGVGNQEKIKEIIAKRRATAAGFMLLEEEAKKLMTPEAVKQHYDKVWDKNFKGTKEFSLTAITTADKGVADQIKNTIKDLDSLKKFLATNSSTTKSMEMDARSQLSFPEEISGAVLKQGANTIVGPFEIKGSFMLFYVKSITDAQKKEFSAEFAEEYKKVAIKDFMKEFIEKLYKKYKVQVFNTKGKVVDPFNVIDNKRKEISQKDLTELSKIKDDVVLAKVNKEQVTVKDLKEFFKVKSLLDEIFVSMAKQFNISLEDVIVYAVKLVMDDKLLEYEVKERKYTESAEVQKKLKEVEDMEIKHAYFKENVKVKTEDVKNTFNKFIKSIPEEDKNDNEISVKLAFFATEQEATQALKSIQAGEEKFGNIYKTKSEKKEAIDLGYVKKQGTSPELWNMLKTGASGACCKQIVQLNGAQFGVSGKNFTLIYIADRRPVTLPSLSNEAERNYFQKLAEREKAVDLVKTHLMASIKTVDGKTIEEINKTASDQIDRIISVLLGYAG